MRHKETGEAFLVEIKPRAFESHPQLDLRKEVAENYIRCKKYDWTFKIIFDDEIILSEEQLADFNEYCQLKSRSARKIWFEQYPQNLVRGTSASLFNTLTGSQKKHSSCWAINRTIRLWNKTLFPCKESVRMNDRGCRFEALTE